MIASPTDIAVAVVAMLGYGGVLAYIVVYAGTLAFLKAKNRFIDNHPSNRGDE